MGVRLYSFQLPAVAVAVRHQLVLLSQHHKIIFFFSNNTELSLEIYLGKYTVTMKVHFIIHYITLPHFFCIIVRMAEDVS